MRVNYSGEQWKLWKEKKKFGMPRHLLGASFRAETKFHIVNCQFLWTFQKCSCFTFQRLKGPKQQLSPPPPSYMFWNKRGKKKKKKLSSRISAGLVRSRSWIKQRIPQISAINLFLFFYAVKLFQVFGFLVSQREKKGGGGELVQRNKPKVLDKLFFRKQEDAS